MMILDLEIQRTQFGIQLKDMIGNRCFGDSFKIFKLFSISYYSPENEILNARRI